ncbi:MAG: hypothetical protein IKR79_02535 [Bacteroidales bacterium]|nr:hypothetical protein [Bacteroidales bacterium]
METRFIVYKGCEYPIITIPNIFSIYGDFVTIGSESLNKVLFNEENGYTDEEAERIDESIYAYMDDNCFELSARSFIKKAKLHLD